MQKASTSGSARLQMLSDSVVQWRSSNSCTVNPQSKGSSSAGTIKRLPSVCAVLSNLPRSNSYPPALAVIRPWLDVYLRRLLSPDSTLPTGFILAKRHSRE